MRDEDDSRPSLGFIIEAVLIGGVILYGYVQLFVGLLRWLGGSS